MPEHGAELPKVFPQQLVSLLSCHGACQVFLARLEAMPPADIRMVLFRVPAFKIAHTQKCPLKFQQPENPCFLGCFPFRFLVPTKCSPTKGNRAVTTSCTSFTDLFGSGRTDGWRTVAFRF